MSDLILKFPNHVVFGPDVIQRIGQIVGALGSRCFILTESVLRQHGTIDHIEDILDRRSISNIVYDEMGPGATTAGLEKLVAVSRASQAEVIVGVGGMRVLAAARVVAAAARGAEVGDVLAGRVREQTGAAYVEVPVSYRNHFMLRDQCMMTDATTHHPILVPLPEGTTRAVIVDPNLTLTMSPKYAAAAMMDTMLAAIEGYVSSRSSFFSDTILIDAISRLAIALKGITETPNEPKHRIRASEAGLLTAMALASSSQGVGGALSYAINSVHSVPKSWVATVLLPHVLDTTVLARPDKLKRVAHALGEEVRDFSPTDAAYQASAAVRRIIGLLELPGRLREMDLAIDDLVDVAELAASLDMSASAPIPHTTSDLYDLVKLAF
ncbi:MAG: iron-containing alcohol dehydrogenase [Spirochaetota bacterium]